MVNKRVFAVKLFHSIIFFVMVFALIYILYCAIYRRYNWTLLAALGAIGAEGLALLLNHWECPFTSLAKRLGDTNGSVTDLFLPDWCARRTFKIAVVVVTIEVILLAWGYFAR
jgi:hypothetical protein